MVSASAMPLPGALNAFLLAAPLPLPPFRRIRTSCTVSRITPPDTQPPVPPPTCVVARSTQRGRPRRGSHDRGAHDRLAPGIEIGDLAEETLRRSEPASVPSVRLVVLASATGPNVVARAKPAHSAIGASRTLHSKLVVAGLMAASCFIALGGFVAFMVLIQDRLVYKPSRHVRGSPQDFGFPLAYPTTIFTTDNATLKGWFLPAPDSNSAANPDSTDASSPLESQRAGSHETGPTPPRPGAATRPTVLYFHGRDKNASFRLGKAKALVDQVDCNLLLLSYRGFGESAPNRFPTEPGMCRDAEAAMRHLAYLARQGQIDPTKIWIYGESLGGGVAVHTAAKYGPIRVRGLILENTFTSLLDMIDRTSPMFSVFKPLSRNRWTNVDKVPGLKMPILFLSGQRDTFIPPEMMKELYTKATGSVMTELVKFPQGTHNRTWMTQGYFESIKRFIERAGDRESSSSSAAVEPSI